MPRRALTAGRFVLASAAVLTLAGPAMPVASAQTRTSARKTAKHRHHRRRRKTAIETTARGLATATATRPGASGSSGPAPATTRDCPDAQLMPDATNTARIRVSTLCLVNNIRAGRRLGALVFNDRLNGVAQAYSFQMVVQNFFGHFAPGGVTPLTRVMSSGYAPTDFLTATFGENLAWGTQGLATPAAIVDAWYRSPEHLANMVNPAFRDTGIGVVSAVPSSLASGPGATYTQEFGAITQ